MLSRAAGLAQPSEKFRLITRLGGGGMGEVHLALARGPVGFQQLQVLKFLRDDLDPSVRDDVRRMFEDEARLAAQLNHPNIVRCHEVQFDDERSYLAMEFLEGQSLLTIQRRTVGDHSAFTLAMRVLVLCQVLEALHYAHELSDYHGAPLGIVHRDVSPDNVFVTYAGQVKLMDFGIAKTLHSYRTMTGVVKGKVGYMAPEQVLGDAVDPRTDLYAVGILLWEAVAATPMHSADQMPLQIMDRVTRGTLPALEVIAPDADAELRAIVTRAIQREPEARYQSAHELLDALTAWLDRQPRVVPREVGAWVRQTFIREAEALKAIIQRGLEANADEQPSGAAAASPPSPSPMVDESLGIYAATRPVVPQPELPSTRVAQRPQGAGWPVSALALAALAILAMVIFPRETESPAGPTSESPGSGGPAARSWRTEQGRSTSVAPALGPTPGPGPASNDMAEPGSLPGAERGAGGAGADGVMRGPGAGSTSAAAPNVAPPTGEGGAAGQRALPRPPAKRPGAKREPPPSPPKEAKVSAPAPAEARPPPSSDDGDVEFPLLSPVRGHESAR